MNSKPVSNINERDLIDHLCSIFNPVDSSSLCESPSGPAFSGSDIFIGAGRDDCAVLDISDTEYLVITTDMLHRKTDFPPQMTPWQMGWMSAAVNLSDVAAMGADPAGLLMALGITEDMDLDLVDQLAQGVQACVQYCKTRVIGGDMDLHDELTITGTALGRVSKHQLLRRQGARVGDLVCVTGNAGSAGAALIALEKGLDASEELLRTLFEPVPRVHEGQMLAQSGAVTSMMDTSDGLSLSLYDLARVNGVGFEIGEEALPVDPELFGLFCDEDITDLALYSGGDFELLFTVDPEKISEAESACYLNVVGKVIEQSNEVNLIRRDQTRSSIYRKGYVHIGELGNI